MLASCVIRNEFHNLYGLSYWFQFLLSVSINGFMMNETTLLRILFQTVSVKKDFVETTRLLLSFQHSFRIEEAQKREQKNRNQ